jgi:hypothetical protein
VSLVEEWSPGVPTANLPTCAFRYKGIKQMDGNCYLDNQKEFN